MLELCLDGVEEKLGVDPDSDGLGVGDRDRDLPNTTSLWERNPGGLGESGLCERAWGYWLAERCRESPLGVKLPRALAVTVIDGTGKFGCGAVTERLRGIPCMRDSPIGGPGRDPKKQPAE